MAGSSCIYDCNYECVGYWPDLLIGNGYCESEVGTWGLNFNCPELNCEGGDCECNESGENGECLSGYIEDCSGDGDCAPETWLGDGYCDGVDQPYGYDLTCYGNDGGDCGDPSSYCGDGTCDLDEDFLSCPEDCTDDVDCQSCDFDFSAYGSECCDSAWEEFDLDCQTLESNYGWDCSGCNCPGDESICGDGNCDSDENSTSCPEDCLVGNCAENEFECDNGSCIPENYYCDGSLEYCNANWGPDCSDGSDEGLDECGYEDECEEEYECPDGYVIDCDGTDNCCDEAWIGDGYPDCEDQQYDCDLTCYDNDGGDCGGLFSSDFGPRPIIDNSNRINTTYHKQKLIGNYRHQYNSRRNYFEVFPITLISNINIKGASTDDVILNGENLVPIMFIQDVENIIISDLTITRGSNEWNVLNNDGTGSGVKLYNSNGISFKNVDITNCSGTSTPLYVYNTDFFMEDVEIYSNEITQNCAGISFVFGTSNHLICGENVNIRDNVFYNYNTFSGGAGISNGATTIIEGINVFNNEITTLPSQSFSILGKGGGIYNVGSLILKNCRINNNSNGDDLSSGGIGGGIYSSGYLSVENSEISNNSVIGREGGGIYASGILDLNHTLITDNRVDNYPGESCQGGGVWYDTYSICDTYLEVKNTTVANNQICNDSYSKGTGIYFNDDQYNPNWIQENASNIVVFNSIVWGNRKGTSNQYPQIDAQTINSNIIVDHSNIQGGQSSVIPSSPEALIWGNGNLISNPLFESDYSLQNNSSCIDAGINSFTYTHIPYTDDSSCSQPDSNYKTLLVLGDQYYGTNPDIGSFEFLSENGNHGCMDPDALNYNSQADYNDGS